MNFGRHAMSFLGAAFVALSCVVTCCLDAVAENVKSQKTLQREGVNFATLSMGGTQRNVYLKNSRAFIFSPAENRQMLKMKDTIFVGPHSEATLELLEPYGGGKILLGSNTIVTLVQLGKNNEVPTLQIKQGQMQVLKAGIEVPQGKVGLAENVQRKFEFPVLVSYESQALVLNPSLEKSVLSVSESKGLKVTRVGAQEASLPKGTGEVAASPVVINLAKIDNLDSEPLQKVVFEVEKSQSFVPSIRVPASTPLASTSQKNAQSAVEPEFPAIVDELPATVVDSPAVVVEPLSVVEVPPEQQEFPVVQASHWRVAAGISKINYLQSNASAISGQLLTIEGSYQAKLTPHLRLQLGGEATLAPIYLTPTGVALRFYKIKSLLSSTIPAWSSSWFFSFSSGFNLADTRAQGLNVGYRRVLSVEALGALKRVFSSGNALELSLGLAPALNASDFNWSKRELSVEAFYHFAPNAKGQYFSLQGKHSSLNVTIDSVDVHSQALTLGAAWNW